ncbi:MAG: hypothetical protein JWN12_750, partial [Candidatus Saccharibacteria bacterium]|nr:hypothetical protein [Candidatus Saccharibacteria bacterium]
CRETANTIMEVGAYITSVIEQFHIYTLYHGRGERNDALMGTMRLRFHTSSFG